MILPVLLLLVFAAAEISLYLWNAELAAKAVQLGLRRAIVSDAVAWGPGLESERERRLLGRADPRAALRPGRAQPVPELHRDVRPRRSLCLPGGHLPLHAGSGAWGADPGGDARGPAGIGPGNVEITYATNGLGYVGRPAPVPVDVTLRLVGYEYTPLFLGGLFGGRMPLRAAATLPGEGLLTQ